MALPVVPDPAMVQQPVPVPVPVPAVPMTPDMQVELGHAVPPPMATPAVPQPLTMGDHAYNALQAVTPGVFGGPRTEHTPEDPNNPGLLTRAGQRVGNFVNRMEFGVPPAAKHGVAAQQDAAPATHEAAAEEEPAAQTAQRASQSTAAAPTPSTSGDLGAAEGRYNKQQQQANAAIETGYDIQAKAIQTEAKLKGEADQAEADLQAANQKRIDKIEADRLAQQAAVDADVAKQKTVVSSIEQKQKETVFDPNRFMKSIGTEGRILSGVAIALGSFGQALTHSGSNTALDIINSSINNDIQAQREQFDAGEKSLSSARTTLGELVKQGLSVDVAANAARQIALSNTIAQVQQMRLKMAPGIGQANADRLTGVLRTEYAKAAQATSTQQLTASVSLINAKAEARAREAAGRGVVIEGVGVAKDEASAARVKVLLDKKRTLMDQFSTIENNIAQSKSRGISGMWGETKDRTQVTTLAARRLMADALKVKYNKYGSKMIDEMVPDASGVDWKGNDPATLDQSKTIAMRALDAQIAQELASAGGGKGRSTSRDQSAFDEAAKEGVVNEDGDEVE